MSEIYSYKTILIGDSNVGKTHLIHRFLDNSFGPKYQANIGSQFGLKDFDLNGRKFKLQIWDTAGQERFMNLAPIYYRNAIGGLLVYDITRRESFENLAKWLSQAREKGHREMSIILVGNKSDLVNERVVSYEEGEKFAEEHGLRFFETSCKASYNVTEAFEKMAGLISEKLVSGVIGGNEIAGGPLRSRHEIPNNGNCAC